VRHRSFASRIAPPRSPRSAPAVRSSKRKHLPAGEFAATVGVCDGRLAGYFSAYPNGTLDPAGLVKGWAIQRASQMLAAAGSTSHCVNGGGDVHCAGRPHAGALWRVGVADPARAAELVAVVAGTDMAVATSGSAERGAHIVNPRTGRAPTALASVTLIGSDLGSTDAYATAAFAMEHDAPAWIDTLEAYRGLVIFADGRQWSSANFATQS